MENEKRLIQQMAKRLIEAFPQADRNNPCPFVYYETYKDIVWDIADEMVDTLAPTVDAAPVVYGRWIKRNWSVTCSVCGSLAIAHDGKNYCPNCGAKMDGERKDHG